ncbi:hypothetical protein SRHO_G00127970 [Serrasalmus rhombeus]
MWPKANTEGFWENSRWEFLNSPQFAIFKIGTTGLRVGVEFQEGSSPAGSVLAVLAGSVAPLCGNHTDWTLAEGSAWRRSLSKLRSVSECLRFSLGLALIDKYERQFETLDVQTAQMEDTMGNSTTLTTPQNGVSNA